MAFSQTEQIVADHAELHSAIASAQPGDIIVMANGVWMDVDILFEADGAPGDSITLTVERPGEVILSGQSRLRIAGDYLKVDGLVFMNGYLEDHGSHVIQFRNSGNWANHSRLTNTTILDYNVPGNDLASYNRWVSLYGTHNRVDHNHFEGKTNDGTTLVVWLHEEPNYHRIDNNYFVNRPDIDSDDAETIRIGTSAWSMHDSRTIVEHNLFERCNGEGEIISNKSGENIYRYNTFLESEGALTLRHGNRATVNGNFFIGNNKERTGGVRVLGDDHLIYNNYFEGLMGDGQRSTLTLGNGYENPELNAHFRARRTVVAFNTFYNNKVTFDIGYGLRPGRVYPPKDVIMANNLVYTSRSPIIQETDEAENMTFEGNIMYSDFIEHQPQRLGIEQPEGIMLIDPEFELSFDGLYRPSAASPALGAAEGDYPFLIDDMDGQPRPDTGRDVGADQYSAQPVVRGPLTAQDVGPRWRRSVSQTDSLALVALYHETNGQDWTNNSGWLELPVSQWHGVKGMDPLMRVTRLELEDNNLQGELPAAIGDLANLEYLNLSGNQIGGELPPAMENLTHLKKLNLDGNELTGEIPSALSSLRHLKILSLQNNLLEGDLPAWPADLDSLESLHLSGNAFTGGSMPGWLQGMSGLKSLKLASTHRTGELPDWFGGLTQMRTLVLDGNQLSGPIPAELAGMAGLDSLNLASNLLEGELPEQLGGITPLNALVISGNAGLEGPIPMSFTNLLYIRVFEFSGTGLCEPANESFSNWMNYIQSNPDPAVYSSVQGTGVECVDTSLEEQHDVPVSLDLYQNYPNPFNPATTIRYDIPDDGVHVRLTVYNMLGQRVATLVDAPKNAGRYQVSLDAARLSSGTYVYRLDTGGTTLARQMVILK